MQCLIHLAWPRGLVTVKQPWLLRVSKQRKLPGRPILRPVVGRFPIYLGLGVYGHGVCLHSLQVCVQTCVFVLHLHGCACAHSHRVLVRVLVFVGV